MAFRYSNSIECGNDVQLSIATEGVQALTEWERVSILDSDVVQSSGIMADPHTSSWLGGKEERGSCGRCGLSNEAFVKHFINPFLNTTELGRGEWTVLMVPWLLPWRDLDLMIPRPVRREFFSILGEECFNLVPVFLGCLFFKIAPMYKICRY